MDLQQQQENMDFQYEEGDSDGQQQQRGQGGQHQKSSGFPEKKRKTYNQENRDFIVDQDFFNDFPIINQSQTGAPQK